MVQIADRMIVTTDEDIVVMHGGEMKHYIINQTTD